MYALCALVAVVAIVSGLSVHQSDPYEAISKIKVPIHPILISCSPQDIVVISSPVVSGAHYYLSRPNGETTKLNLTKPTFNQSIPHFFNDYYDNVIVKHEKHFKGILSVHNYRVFDLLPDKFGEVNENEEHVKNINSNDFVIGPLLHSDHGNWMLSAYYVDDAGEWVEMYQVITIEIVEYVPPHPSRAILKSGDTFEFSFAYPIPGLEGCELHTPKSTFDRFYERDVSFDSSRCRYVIKNVTKADRGIWRISALGNIVYKTQLFLDFEDGELKNKTIISGALS